MEPGTHFQPFIPDASTDLVAPEEIKRHIVSVNARYMQHSAEQSADFHPRICSCHQFCSGQVYFALTQEREARGLKNVAISRVEQLSPVPYNMIVPGLDQYPNAETYWVQEEPLNGGPWGYLQPR